MEDASSKSMLTGYASYLAENKLLDKDIAMDAIHQAIEERISYTKWLIDKRLISEAGVAKSTSEYFGLPLFDISAFDLDKIPKEYLNIHLVNKRQALPLFINANVLYIAVSDPTIEHLYEIKFHTGLNTRLVITEESKLIDVIDEIINSISLSEIDNIDNAYTEQVNVSAMTDGDINIKDVESAKIVNYLNKVLIDAVKINSSDIHFEPYEDTYRIRYRQHGILYTVKSPPHRLANYLLARIKVISHLDITEHRIPQDGRFKLVFGNNRAIDFRVSICPTLFGEKVVLRILDKSQAVNDIPQIGLKKEQMQHYYNVLNRSQGMIIVTGPTGSGKTVTLYAGLRYLNSTEVNISTVEDPVEIPLQGINQVNVNLKTGLTFTSALRSFLRQDPDIIMVGEIRDLKTAGIAVKAAQTGHLVLSTLHTNGASETIVRLMNMGIKPYNVASSLTLVIAQRLLRVLCSYCKIPQAINQEILLLEGFTTDEINQLKLYEPGTCDKCISGYIGRTGIFEVMPISREMSQLIMRSGSAIEIADLAKKEGIATLREAGLEKVKSGVTSLTELNRVFK